jgi:glycogen debranching enzyme
MMGIGSAPKGEGYDGRQMTTESIRAVGLEEALALMRSCIVREGFLATPEHRDNYRRIWARDSSIMSLAAAASGDDWEELQMSFSYSFKNRPYEFHNGGLWPLITGFYAADLAQRGRRERALHFVEAVHHANAFEMDGHAWSFPEFVHGKELCAMGNRRQGWSAAVAVLAEQALAGEPVFSVPSHLY